MKDQSIPTITNVTKKSDALTADFVKNPKEVLVSLQKDLKQIKRFKKIGSQQSSIILSQDLFAKDLAKKNQDKLKVLVDSPPQSLEEKLELMTDIMFTNFEITNANIEMTKAYIDEYYDRFILLEKSLTVILKGLESVVVGNVKGDV